MIGETFDAPDGDPRRRGTIVTEVPILAAGETSQGLLIAQPADVAKVYADERARRDAFEALMDHRPRSSS